MKKNSGMLIFGISIILLLLSVTLSGIFSFDRSHVYEVMNQYGEKIRIWGAGIYAHDSYFKAPIFIGSDFAMLVFILPLYLGTSWKLHRQKCPENYICNFGVLCLILYYSGSLALGASYNNLHLLYIALFGVSFYLSAFHFMKLYSFSASGNKVCEYTITKGMKAFLLIAGISLFAAWLPDILYSIFNGTSLDLIEVYTTEITYVLDMGLISPLMFITLFLVKQEKFTGYVLLRMVLKVCMGIGIILPFQTIFQVMSGISIPIPAIITKVLLFIIMALFAAFFEYRLKHQTNYILSMPV